MPPSFNPHDLIIQPMTPAYQVPSMELLKQVFHKEQQIPVELIPLQQKNQRWWIMLLDGKVIGTVAAWEDDEIWHWGRLAIQADMRGGGLGKKLIHASLTALFSSDIEKIRIDAREITVHVLLKLGGKIIGPTGSFYGTPITPMEIHHKEFIHHS